MFTGRISVTRKRAQAIVEELGGTAGSSVSRNTDFLVVGEDYGSKFTHAQMLDVKCIDEDAFWAVVNEARVEEEDYSNLKGTLTESTFFNILDKLDAKAREAKDKKEDYPPTESMTYFSKENLDKWLEEQAGAARRATVRPVVIGDTDAGQDWFPASPIKPKLGERVCPYCSYEIPYSISSTHWYCFKCNLFSDPGQEKAYHACVDWEWSLDTELGFYENCKVCGNVKFVASSEVDSIAKLGRRCNYVHSLEFAAKVAGIYAVVDRRDKDEAKLGEQRWDRIQAGLGDWDEQKLYAQFEKREIRRSGKFESQYPI